MNVKAPLAKIVIACVLAAGAACTSVFAFGAASYDWASSPKPSSAQLESMSSYFKDHAARAFFRYEEGGAHVGCATYSLGTEKRGSLLFVYSTVLCSQCPTSVGLSGEFPVAFHLRGNHVVYEGADIYDGPKSTQDLQRLFPRALWTAAEEQQIPNVMTLVDESEKRGGC